MDEKEFVRLCKLSYIEPTDALFSNTSAFLQFVDFVTGFDFCENYLYQSVTQEFLREDEIVPSDFSISPQSVPKVVK